MKVESTSYVIMKTGNIIMGSQTVFVDEDSESGFTNNISLATKYATREAALAFKRDLELYKNNGYESDMQIIPVKTIYEW